MRNNFFIYPGQILSYLLWHERTQDESQKALSGRRGENFNDFALA
jgi:hypothetical protein